MKTIYFISGLGADERVFQYLQLNGVNTKYIHWEIPQKRESLRDYSRRLIPQIDLSGEVILVGVSFGGMVAQEISKIIPVHKVIILSSIKNIHEFDWQLKLVRALSLYRLVPSRILKWSNLLTGNYYFGTKTKAESDLLKLIIRDTDRLFMKWAIREIMRWNHDGLPNHDLVHIHGDNDRIFPIKNIVNTIRIKGGGHFMIVNRADEISAIIEQAIR